MQILFMDIMKNNIKMRFFSIDLISTVSTKLKIPTHCKSVLQTILSKSDWRANVQHDNNC